jgi:exopolysaccharide production protein ExoQ
MPPRLALLFGVFFVFVAFVTERRRNVGMTQGVLWPTIWYIVVASRPIGVWLSIWGLSIPGMADDPVDGSIIDRLFYTVLTIIGLRILSRRNFSWSTLIKQNKWLTLFIVYIALSILWSDYPFVSFKRFIKVFGSIVMAMVVLTTDRPLDGMLTVIRRCLYIHIPMSLVCVKYFREVGVSYEWDGAVEFWQGISTSKNTLGQVTMLAVLYFIWDFLRNWRANGIFNVHIAYLLMAIFLLKGSNQAVSLTSVAVCVFALLVFFTMQVLKNRPMLLRTFVTATFLATATLVILVLIHSVVLFPEQSFFGKIITTFGRDITLTDRTYIWTDVYQAASGNPLFGVGFGGFWIGRVANIPWNENMTWVLGQAHSGYVDTYLQIGLVGGLMLAGVLVFSLPKMFATLKDDFDFGCFRITLMLTIAFINITESVYLRGDHHLWLVLQIVLWSVPMAYPYAEAELEETVVYDVAR